MPSRAQRRAKKRAQTTTTTTTTASTQPKHLDDSPPTLTATDPASPPPPAVAVGVSTSSAPGSDEPVSRGEFLRLRAELEEMRTKHSATLAAHDVAMNKKLNEIGLLSSQVEKFRADISALQDELQRAVARAQIAKAVEQRRKASEAALQQQLEATQAELAEALVAGASAGVVASADATTPYSNSSLERLETKVHTTAAEQAAQQAQSAERMGSFEEQVHTLRESINSGAAERQTLLAALATAEQRVEALTAEKADLEVRLLAPLKTPVANGPQPVLASPGGSPITPERLSFSPQMQSRELAVAHTTPAKGPLAALVDFVRRALAHVMALFSPTRATTSATTPLLA